MSRPPLLILAGSLLPSSAYAANDDAGSALLILVAVSAGLVFFMQAGFALLESGLVRAKNTVNVILKNFTDMAVGILAFWLIGYGLMFGVNTTGWIGESGFAISGSGEEMVGLLYQMMFAATAATIVSGAVAERMRYGAYLFATLMICAVIYPLFGAWAWGGTDANPGWLKGLGFIDFAGSTVVHSLGAWCALAAVIVLGPRTGRFGPQGEIREVPGHSLPLMATGGFILWFGWFGFNGGSIGDLAQLGPVLVNTQLSGAGGVLGVVLVNLLRREQVLAGGVVNGGLGGLVAITAGAASMHPALAVLTGVLGGMLAVEGSRWLLVRGIDDVVGAIPVHGFAGAWGTVAAGMFYAGDLFDPGRVLVQVLGVGIAFMFGFGAMWLTLKLSNRVNPIRATTRHEQYGLDFTEHGETGYPEFQRALTHGGRPE